jgi:TonB family protein
MRAMESWLFGYLLNALWQAPLVLAAAWTAARLARPVGPRLEHRVWVSALLLQVVLPLCAFRLSELWRQVHGLALWLWGSPVAGGETRVVVGAARVSAGGALRLPSEVFVMVAVVYTCSLLYFAGRLLWGLWKTNALRRRAVCIELTSDASLRLERLSRLSGISTDEVEIAASSEIAGPVTVGVWRRMLLLPPGFPEQVGGSDLDVVLAHEMAHIRRRDFAKNLLYEAATLPMAWHPAVWFTRSRLAETREMICDAMAAEAVLGREMYARSLLRLASMLSDRTPARTLHAIGILDANTFERRVMTLTRKYAEIRGVRRFAIAAACGVAALATCATALALRMNVAVPGNGMIAAHGEEKKPIHVNADFLKKISGDNPVYPKIAKAAHVTGTVVLRAVISKDGTMENLEVVDGPSMLVASAMEAVQTWRYEPYLLNGEPVKVETTLNVIFELSD